jgi:hypothetical protein
MRAGPASANHTAMLSVSARKISLRCFLACPRSTYLLSTVRADQNLFDLIRSGSGFLTVAKAIRSFRNIGKLVIPIIKKFATNSSCPRVFLCLNGDVPFLSFLVYGLLKRRHAG